MTTETIPETTVPLEPTTPIKPSEAIRLGCLIAPVQGFGNYIGLDGTACAVGAAALGWGGADSFSDVVSADMRITEAVNGVACPEPGCTEHTSAHVPILNDTHRWSRERIADWLEGLGL